MSRSERHSVSAAKTTDADSKRRARSPRAGRFALAALFALPLAAWADGLFVGVDGGFVGADGVALTRTNHGVPTNCDGWLGGYDLDGDGEDDVPLPPADCAPRALPASPTAIGLDGGFRVAATVGYAAGRLRAALEYARQERRGEVSSLVVPGDPKQQEFVRRDEAADRLRADSLFANASWDLTSAAAGRWTPYVGAGVGVVRATIDYAAISVRTDSRDALIALGRNPNAAGTTSRADARLADTLLGYQLLAGARCRLGPRRALDIRLRYGGFADDFSNRGNRWRRLRDHDSTVAPGGAPVLYDIDAEGFAAWSVSVGLVWQPR